MMAGCLRVKLDDPDEVEALLNAQEYAGEIED
jgi:hypothetical protein